MVYPALLPLMRTPRLPGVDWTDTPRRFKWTRPFRRKTKSGFCACAITFQLASTQWHDEVHYFNTCTVHLLLFALWPINAQLFHKLSHYYMFRHYRVIIRELVINTLPSCTSISAAAVGNTIYNWDVSRRSVCTSLNGVICGKTENLHNRSEKNKFVRIAGFPHFLHFVAF